MGKGVCGGRETFAGVRGGEGNARSNKVCPWGPFGPIENGGRPSQWPKVTSHVGHPTRALSTCDHPYILQYINALNISFFPTIS